MYLSLTLASVSKDRGWFKNYTPFVSTLENLPVLGIGTVEIPTKRSPNLSGASSHGSLELQEVLHVPGFICNVVGFPVLSDGHILQLASTPKSNGTIKDRNGKNVAYFDPKILLPTLKLRRPSTLPELGSHVLKNGEMYWLRCQWDPAEQQKWQEFKDKTGPSNLTSRPTDAVDRITPYTVDEKVYLKEHWRSEYHFLLEHSLNIYKEEDRAEGRTILRAYMDEDTFNDISEDDELDLLGHQADHNFSPAQLHWIERYYGNSEKFMLCYGLKFYNDDDIEEAKAIVNAVMAQDNVEGA